MKRLMNQIAFRFGLLALVFSFSGLIYCGDDPLEANGLNENQAREVVEMLRSALSLDPSRIMTVALDFRDDRPINNALELEFIEKEGWDQNPFLNNLGNVTMEYWYSTTSTAGSYVDGYFLQTVSVLEQEQNLQYEGEYYFIAYSRGTGLSVPSGEDNELQNESQGESDIEQFTITNTVDENGFYFPVTIRYSGTPKSTNPTFQYSISGELNLDGDIDSTIYIEFTESFFQNTANLSGTIGGISFTNYF